MSPTKTEHRIYYEFGKYRIDVDKYCLYRNGELVLLPPKEFELLLVLVTHHGEVVSREELIRKLWPDTIVEEANLNVHISALRKIFGESPDAHQYIQTLPRRGYRFVPEVREAYDQPEAERVGAPSPPVAAPPATQSDPAGAAGIAAEAPSEARPSSTQNAAGDWYTRHRLGAVIMPLWLLAIALICILAVLFFKPPGPTTSNEGDASSMAVVPLTTYPGRETHAAFSPDGNQIAFVWRGEKDDNADIYVRQLVDGSKPVRLTTHPGDDVNPAWSSDGQMIAFYRRADEGDGIYTVPSLGGAERKLTDTWANRFEFGSHTWLHWSPDGKWLVVSDKSSEAEPFSLFLVSPQTGERRRLTTPPASVIGDCSPSFSPDGTRLAFVRVIGAFAGDIYIVRLDGGQPQPPQRLTFDGVGISNLAWAPNSREIIYSSRRGERARLFRIPLDGGTPQAITISGNDAHYPSFSRRGNRLAWTQYSVNIDIYRIDLKASPESNKLAPSSGLISSTVDEASPSYSPDGKRIAFASSRSGNREIWVCSSEGENPIRLTSFRGPLVGSPRWSPDGRHVVFDSRPDGNPDIFVTSRDGGQPRRLTDDPAEDIVPSWSGDGQWIYFTSNRSGRLQIWKIPAAGGKAIQITRQGGFEATESPDGQWLYYTQDRGSASIRRVPVNGGEETPVFDFHQNSYSRMWTVKPEGIYFATAESLSRSAIKFFNLSSGNITSIALVEGTFSPGESGLAVSPDNRWLLFPRVVQRGGDLMMIENFH